MYVLNGKTIIFTDMHCGLSGNRVSRLNICVTAIKELMKAVSEHGAQNIVFAGDWYHSRTTLDVNTINVSLKLIQALSKKAKLYLICGNHDAFLKNSTDINSLNMFKDTPNVVIVDKPEEAIVNSQKCLMVPWLTDLTKYQESSFDMMIGHFEISSKYLMQSYIEDNRARKTASDKTVKKLEADNLVGGQKSTSLIGSFVDLVRKGGTIYAGHIHKHKEFVAKGREFVFVGAPYQQTLADIDSDCGYYVLDEQNRRTFKKITTTPVHVRIIMSDAVSGKCDFKNVPGNIIQRVYDQEISSKDEAAVNQRINDLKPYEELLPDYAVSVGSASAEDSQSLELIRKSKLEYIKNYIDNIDQSVVDEQKLDRDRLFEILEKYYKKVTDRQ